MASPLLRPIPPNEPQKWAKKTSPWKWTAAATMVTTQEKRYKYNLYLWLINYDSFGQSFMLQLAQISLFLIKSFLLKFLEQEVQITWSHLITCSLNVFWFTNCELHPLHFMLHTCLSNEHLWRKFLLQWTQWCGFSPVWISSCFLTTDRDWNFLSQNWHENRINPEHFISCFLWSSAFANCFLHETQMYFFDKWECFTWILTFHSRYDL